jgi:hypothetical protein
MSVFLVCSHSTENQKGKHGGNVGENNKKHFVEVHQHGGDDVTCKRWPNKSRLIEGYFSGHLVGQEQWKIFRTKLT